MPTKIINVYKESIKLFNQICIEVSSKCNRTCSFCPNSVYSRPDEQMSWTMINNIIDDLARMNYGGRVTPYIYNEPMRDRRLLEFFELVSQKLPIATLMMNTNGDYIKGPDDIGKLFDAGLRQLCINVYAAVEDEAGLKAAEARAVQLEGWLSQFLLDGDNASGPIGKEEVHAVVMRKFSGQFGKFKMSNRSGNLKTIPALAEPRESMCVRPFRVLNIDWRGNAVLCCNDYYSTVTPGNVNDMSLEDIWNSPLFHAYRLNLQVKNRHIPLCNKCDFNGEPHTHMVQHVTFGETEDKTIRQHVPIHWFKEKK